MPAKAACRALGLAVGQCRLPNAPAPAVPRRPGPVRGGRRRPVRPDTAVGCLSPGRTGRADPVGVGRLRGRRSGRTEKSAAAPAGRRLGSGDAGKSAAPSSGPPRRPTRHRSGEAGPAKPGAAVAEAVAAGCASPVRVVFLGGLGEIGRNCACIEVDGRILVLDVGIMFPDPDMPGVDLVLPDFTYLRENADRVDGVILTHGHEDHTGGLAYLLRDFPVASTAPS